MNKIQKSKISAKGGYASGGKYQNENSKFKISEKAFEFLEHTADLKIRAFGKSLKELFINMAKGMMSSMVDKPVFAAATAGSEINRTIKIASNDLEGLLIDYLSELLYLTDVNNEIYNNYEIKNLRLASGDCILNATVSGYKVKRFGLEIKAVTYSDLKIYRENKIWLAEVVFDI